MIHLDTNLLIDLVTVGSPHITIVRQWLEQGEELAVSAITWSEFLNGPHTRPQKEAVQSIVGNRILDFGVKEAERASRLFHYTGRKRGSHSDCMIAAAAMVHDVRIATRNVSDFEKFVPHGLQLLAVPTLT